MKIQLLKSLSVRGVFSLVNASRKRVYVGSSVNVLGAVCRLIDDCTTSGSLSELRDDMPELELMPVEEIEIGSNDPGPPGLGDADESEGRALRLAMYKVVSRWLSEGYTLYRDYPGMSYKLKTVLDVSGNTVVMLTRAGCEPIIVAVYSLPLNAELFVRTNYKNRNNVTDIVYAKNALTKEYILRYSE